MTCYELLRPYVRWAANDQLSDPFRYVLGFQLGFVQTEGALTTIDGIVDIDDVQFESDSERFAIRLRGRGTLYSQGSQSLAQVNPNLSATTGNGLVTNESRKILIQIDANNERILVRIGDVALHAVIERFTARCQDGFLVGFADNKAYLLGLQKLERVESGWKIVDSSQPVEQVIAAPAPPAPPPAPPKAAEPDDLQRIEGIGPKTVSTLNKLGITTFAQLAELDPDQLEKNLTDNGLSVMRGAAHWWPAQAALAATGHWNQLKAVQTELLKGGRFSIPDNLEKISGIGPVIATQLDLMGITTFRQLAEADPEQLEGNLKAAGVHIPLGTAVTWPEQAKLATEQRWVELENTKRELAQLHHELEDTVN